MWNTHYFSEIKNVNTATKTFRSWSDFKTTFIILKRLVVSLGKQILNKYFENC